MGEYDLKTPQEVYAKITELATKDSIKGLPSDGSPNLILYNGI